MITASETIGKIHAAVDARLDDSMVLIARTDARAMAGLDEACDRAQLYLDAGANVAFVEAPSEGDEIREIGKRIAGPLLINIVEGGLTSQLPLAELSEMGFKIVLHANSAMRASIVGMREVLTHLKKQGDTLGIADRIATWDERQSLVRKPLFDQLEDRYRG